MKIFAFADTNVFLDIFLDRASGNECKEIFRLAESKNIQLFISAPSLQTIIYFLQKAGIKTDAVILLVENLLSFVTIISPDEQIIRTALRTGFTDLEDAIQYYTAAKLKGMDYFITSNIKDFKKANEMLTVISPKQFIQISQ